MIEAVSCTAYCDCYTCRPAKQPTVMTLVFCQTTLGTPILIFYGVHKLAFTNGKFRADYTVNVPQP